MVLLSKQSGHFDKEIEMTAEDKLAAIGEILKNYSDLVDEISGKHADPWISEEEISEEICQAHRAAVREIDQIIKAI